VHVPYKGASPAVTDLIAGHVDVIFDQMSSAIGYIRGNRLRALAITAKSRAPELPEVPTMHEAGVRGVEAGTFTAILAPARTPQPVVQRLNQATSQVLAGQAARAAFGKQGAQILESTPQSAAKYIADELAKWRAVVRNAGIKPQPD
jgi:tripartite-type tricarboxylate transporter receptor subunit TctC